MVHHQHGKLWGDPLSDAGEQTEAGGRLRKMAKYLREEPDFCLTCGDGLVDIDGTADIALHRAAVK